MPPIEGFESAFYADPQTDEAERLEALRKAGVFAVQIYLTHAPAGGGAPERFALFVVNARDAEQAIAAFCASRPPARLVAGAVHAEPLVN